MATVNTNVTLTYEPFPFSGIPAPNRDISDVPVREMRVYAQGATIAATGAGDNQQVNFNCALPRNYAYVLVDCFLRIYGAAGATNNFDNQMSGAWSDGQTTITKIVPLELLCQGAANDVTVEIKNYTPRRLPSNVMLPSIGTEQVTLLARIYNATANDGAYTADFFARFLEYSITQANHYRVNTPSPVRP